MFEVSNFIKKYMYTCKNHKTKTIELNKEGNNEFKNNNGIKLTIS